MSPKWRGNENSMYKNHHIVLLGRVIIYRVLLFFVDCGRIQNRPGDVLSTRPTLPQQPAREVRQWMHALYQIFLAHSWRVADMAYIEKREGKNGVTYRAQIKRKGAP